MTYRYPGADVCKDSKGKTFILTGERREIKTGDYFLAHNNKVCRALQDYKIIASIAKEAKKNV